MLFTPKCCHTYIYIIAKVSVLGGKLKVRFESRFVNLVTWTKVHFLEQNKTYTKCVKGVRSSSWWVKNISFTEKRFTKKKSFWTVLTYSFEDPLFFIELHERDTTRLNQGKYWRNLSFDKTLNVKVDQVSLQEHGLSGIAFTQKSCNLMPYFLQNGSWTFT